MVHQYKNNGYDIVLDVNSGAIHVVDDVTYDVIALYEGHTREEIVNSLRERYPETEVEEALDEVQMLVDNEELFTKDTYENLSWISKSARRLSRLCACTLRMTATLPVSIALPRRASTTGEGLLCPLKSGRRHLIF